MKTPSNPAGPVDPLDAFGDLFVHVAYDNTLQLRRKIETMDAASDAEGLRAIVDLLVDEIGHLKADVGQLRLELLARTTNVPDLPLAPAQDGAVPVTAELPRCLEIAIGGFFSGRGWHRPEVEPGGGNAFRWTGPAQLATIDLFVDRSEPLACEIVAGRAYRPEMLQGLAIRIDDRELAPTIVSEESGRLLIQTVLPADPAASPPSVLGIRLGAAPVSPAEADPSSGDTRALGLLVYKVRLFPKRLGERAVRGKIGRETARFGWRR